MTDHFSPPNKILWDTWFIHEQDEWHMFFLQAPDVLKSRSVDRHHYASIGHASSRDLKSWEYHGTALEAGESTSWDDLCLWTGSVFKFEDQFYLFYTGRSRANYWRQDIGVAISDDLYQWKKVGSNPILSSDNHFYSNEWTLDNRGVAPAWRDPFVYYDKISDEFLMLFCARTNHTDELYNGCIGLARSKDLIQWELQAPILAPGRYAEMEVPQLLHHEGLYYLFFSTKPQNYQPDWAMKHGAHNGLHLYCSPSLDSPFEPAGNTGSISFSEGSIYNARIIRDQSDKFVALGWLEFTDSGQFQGALSALYQVQLSDKSAQTQRISEK